jgi:hypothetical protein
MQSKRGKSATPKWSWIFVFNQDCPPFNSSVVTLNHFPGMRSTLQICLKQLKWRPKPSGIMWQNATDLEKMQDGVTENPLSACYVLHVIRDVTPAERSTLTLNCCFVFATLWRPAVFLAFPQLARKLLAQYLKIGHIRFYHIISIHLPKCLLQYLWVWLRLRYRGNHPHTTGH